MTRNFTLVHPGVPAIQQKTGADSNLVVHEVGANHKHEAANNLLPCLG